jgi:recombination protein RecA
MSQVRTAPSPSPASATKPQADTKPQAPTDPKAEVREVKPFPAAAPAAGSAAGQSGARPAPATPPPQKTDAATAKAAAAKAAEQAEDTKARRKALDLTVGQIEKTFGKGSIMKMNEADYLSVPGISTGALSLDLALGGRGIPRGRIIEIFGPESSGKTTLALSVAANAQKEGGVAAIIDAEHALDPSWARKIGVNIDDLLVSQPDTGEQALEICELLVRSNAVDVIIIDSVAALVPRSEIEGEMGDSSVGVQARLMSQAMRKLTGIIARSNCVVVFINQIREKIGVMFGSPETTTGGRALKFYATVRIDVRRTGAIKEGEVTVGSRTRARVVKNKVAPPFRDAEFDIMYTEGISAAGDLLDLAVDSKIVQKSGAWFSYGEIRVGQGREASKQFLKDNPELFKEIRLKVLDVRRNATAPVNTGGNDEEE